MAHYQIGSEEPRQCVGSRSATNVTLAEAIEECRQYSCYRSIKSAWLREWVGDRLGDTIVTFKKGTEV